MLESFKQSVERSLFRWEDAIATRREWVRLGWATSDLVSGETKFFMKRAAECRRLLKLL
jgi:hypothetical protein